MVQKQACRLLLTTAMSNRAISRLVGKSHNTINKWRERLRVHGLAWEHVKAMTPQDLNRVLNAGRLNARKTFVEPDWATVHEELAKPSVTLTLLYEEYREGLTEGAMSESVFRRRYAEYTSTLNIVMRKPRRPGEELFVDYSGKRPFLINQQTGERRYVELWVGALGASRKTFATCTLTQQLPDFTGAHVKAFEFFGALPQTLVPDNLKPAVTSISRRDGHYINPTYQAFADFYDVTVLPTRPRRPTDKGSVENAVRLTQRWILARLRHRTFFSLEELNEAIYGLLEKLNSKPMRQRGNRSRNELFVELDLPVMRTLPQHRYEFAEWRIGVTIPKDYHVHVEGSYYSVPHHLVGKQVDLAVTESAVRVYQRTQLLATHIRSQEQDHIVTNPDHQPRAHRYAEDQMVEILTWAKCVGPNTHQFLIKHLELHSGARSTNAFKGVKRLSRDHGNARLELACARALLLQSISTSSLRSMLEHGIESKPIDDDFAVNDSILVHENVRGAANYQ